jgi:hypothetical protein
MPETNTPAYYENWKFAVVKSFIRLGPELYARNTEGGSITVPLTSCLTGFELAVFLFLFVKQTNPNQSNMRSTVQ